MNRLLVNLTALLLVIACLQSSQAQTFFEFGRQAVYHGNLLLESDRVVDLEISDNASVRIYPLSMMEISLDAKHTHYREIQGLDNVQGGFTVTLIPLDPDLPYGLYFSTNFSGRRYGETVVNIDNNNFSFRSSVGYWLGEAAYARAGYAYETSRYVVGDEKDKKSDKIFAGINFSFLGKNSLDIQTSYAFASYRFIGPENYYIDPLFLGVTFTDGRIREWDISPKYSRPLGNKLGMSLLFRYKQFMDTEDAIVVGSTNENISPWATVWQGSAVTLEFKSFHVPHMVLGGGVGFWSKHFIKAFEPPPYLVAQIEERRDDQTRVFVNVSRPVKSHLGLQGEPSINIEWSNNSSSIPLHDYRDVTITTGLRLRF